jgi:hypothetical protein
MRPPKKKTQGNKAGRVITSMGQIQFVRRQIWTDEMRTGTSMVPQLTMKTKGAVPARTER